MRIWKQLQEAMAADEFPQVASAAPNPEQEAEAPPEEPEAQPLLPGLHETGNQLKTLNTSRAVLVAVVNDLATVIEAFRKAEGMSTKPEVTSQLSGVHMAALKLATEVHKLKVELGS